MNDRDCQPSDSGSTLIEVLVATLVLVSGVLAMAQLFLIAAATNAAARQATVVTTLAAQKMEQVLATDLAAAPETVDHVDESGRVVGEDERLPSAAVYTRRSSIEALTAGTVVIRVRVGRSDRSGRLRRMSGEIQMLTIKRRTP
jgi:Tfp pilus assembly protein PilV